jgi:hypothetical protein
MAMVAGPQLIARKRAPVWVWFGACIIGLVTGVVSAWSMTGGALGGSNLIVKNWSSDLMIGAPAANPWLRARVSRIGLLALSKQETMYFDRSVDDAGDPLREACTYQIKGHALPARWWSLTIYGKDQFLPRNDDQAGSLDATRTLPDGTSSWSGIISAQKPSQEAHWISSAGAGAFSITLRLYNPASVEPNRLAAMPLPAIEKMACDDARAAGSRS